MGETNFTLVGYQGRQTLLWWETNFVEKHKTLWKNTCSLEKHLMGRQTLWNTNFVEKHMLMSSSFKTKRRAANTILSSKGKKDASNLNLKIRKIHILWCSREIRDGHFTQNMEQELIPPLQWQPQPLHGVHQNN